LWSYNVDLEETRLLNVDEFHIPKDVAQNGFVPVLDVTNYPKAYQKKLKGDEASKMKRPKQRQIFF
jgi:hypothetical protein